eukprot:360880-Chlamydomonas_euryale.AAC.5
MMDDMHLVIMSEVHGEGRALQTDGDAMGHRRQIKYLAVADGPHEYGAGREVEPAFWQGCLLGRLFWLVRVKRDAAANAQAVFHAADLRCIGIGKNVFGAFKEHLPGRLIRGLVGAERLDVFQQILGQLLVVSTTVGSAPHVHTSVQLACMVAGKQRCSLGD